MVALRHSDGSVSTYCHFSSRSVDVGDSVDAGELIGRCGESGRTSGPHVHLGVRTLLGSYVEFFDFTTLQPSPTQLDPGGC
jgi:murein DD-endopeptidase MepM/ murein hydrolase activator NlpD